MILRFTKCAMDVVLLTRPATQRLTLCCCIVCKWFAGNWKSCDIECMTEYVTARPTVYNNPAMCSWRRHFNARPPLRGYLFSALLCRKKTQSQMQFSTIQFVVVTSVIVYESIISCSRGH